MFQLVATRGSIHGQCFTSSMLCHPSNAEDHGHDLDGFLKELLRLCG
jgi:hypothetical protein